MSRLRWRLARLIAPVPIISDPGEGAFVVIRAGPFTSTLKADRLRLKSTQRLRQLTYGEGDPLTLERFGIPGSRSFTRFVGTIGE